MMRLDHTLDNSTRDRLEYFGTNYAGSRAKHPLASARKDCKRWIARTRAPRYGKSGPVPVRRGQEYTGIPKARVGLPV